MSYEIVTVNVSQTVGAVPSDLQRTSAILSFGSTLAEPGKPVLLTQASDIQDYVSYEIQSLQATYDGTSESEFILTLEDGANFHAPALSSIEITIENCVPEEWNGTYTTTIVDESTLTWSVAGTTLTGSPTALGQITLDGIDEIVSAVNAFFAPGNTVATYLLELGAQTDVAGEVEELSLYIGEPLKRFYTYLVPGRWDSGEDFINLAKLHTANTAKLYFFVVTGTPADTNYVSPYAGIKSIVAIADDQYPATNAAAELMWNFVMPSPSEINKVPPMAFRYLLSVYAHAGRASILKTMSDQNINYVGTGAEGGISNTLVVKGVTCDGKDMTYWYSVDWVQINVDMALANEVINGSNNPINPLYYNQDGIDRLQLKAQGVFNSGVSYGLVNGQTPVNAIPFKTYIKNNPNDYEIGRYAGLSATYTPMRGFTSIIFNINVTMQLS